MIVKFSEGAVVRASEINFAHITEVSKKFSLNMSFKTKEWLKIRYDSRQDAEEALEKLGRAMPIKQAE